MSGLRVVFGNRPQELLLALAGELAAFRAATDPFARPVLLFGNSTLREDALATLAAHNGIVANVATPTFDAFLEPLFPAFFPGEPRAARLDRLAFQAGLLAVLAEDGLPAPVTRYVSGSGPQGAGFARPPGTAVGGEETARTNASARARIELAGRLAPLFDGYAQNRPDWILQPATLAALATGDGPVANGPGRFEVGPPSLATAVANGPGRWQVPLLARVLSRLPHHHSVAALAARLRSLPVGSDRDPGLAALPPALFFYAPGLVPEATRQLIAALGRHRPTVVFAFNPCRELWDDLKTARTSARSITPEEVLFDDEGMPIFSGETEEYGSSLFEEAGDPELLVRLGRPLREQVRLWNETVDSDFIDAFREETAYPPTTLGRLQQRLAAREADAAETPDESFVLLAAGSPAREAELAASWITAQARDRQIPLDRLAIVVPSSGDGAEEVYLPALRSAFAELGLPLRGYGVHADAIAQRIAGAAALLAFPRQARTPASVVALLREPALDFAFAAGEGGAGAGGAGATTPEELAKILDDAGIALGHRPRDLAGTYLDPSLHTFDQGFDRIALSLFRPAGDVELQGHRRPLRPIPAGALPALARISELLTEADRLAALEAPLATWADELSTWIRKYFFEKTEFDVRASSTVLSALATLRRLDLGAAPAPTYRYADALRLAEAALASIPTTTRAGAPGVLCGPLSAFRGLPLAAVAFVGFGEGIFPQRASEDPLDLRRGERRPGDILTDDRDRAAFLELFCAVETAIALSWPATDATSGDPLPPSPLLAPFERALLANSNDQLPLSSPVPHRQGRFRADELPRREILEPAWQELQPEDLSPEAIRSADARALGEVLRSAEEDLPLALHHAPLLEPAREAAQKLLHLPSFPPIVREGAAAAPLAIADLVAYVRCPVQGAARARLRLRLEEVDDDGRDGDPLEFEAFRLDNLVVEALFAGPGDVAATTALFRARVEADRVASRLPTAPYASARIEKAEAELGPLIERFRGDGAPITFFELGPGRASRDDRDGRGGRDGREARPAQPFGGRLLQGALPPVIDGAIILPGHPRKNPDDIVKHLSAFRIAELVVARAILMTCFQEPVTAVRVLALGEDLTAKGDTQQLPEWDFYEAELFLQDLIGHASAQIRPRFAPLEAFVNGARSVRAFEEYRETSGRFPPYAAKGPVPGWRDWPVPEEDDLARELDERLGIHAALIRDKEFPG